MKHTLFAVFGLSVMCSLLQTPVAADVPTGHVTGQFVLDGDIPNIEKPVIKDKNCAAKSLPENTLVVDPKTKGIANVVVYIRKKPEAMPEKLATPKKKEVVFDVKDCRFTPHILPVQVGQFVLVKSDGLINHNTHIHPFRNEELGFIMRPKDREGVPIIYTKPERFPIPVTCDFHPHMKAYWMVLDHPYMAVTDEQGKFTIKDLPVLPVNDFEFIVWHERTGYITKTLKVQILAGRTVQLDPYQVDASAFVKIRSTTTNSQ